MQQDSEKTFGEIYNGNPGPQLCKLLSTLQQSQFQLQRSQVQKWASNLRFLCLLSNILPESGPFSPLPTGSEHLDPKPTTDKCSCDSLFDRKPFSSMNSEVKGILHVSDRGAAPACRHYLAVSYCWQHTPKISNDGQPREPYPVQTKSETRPSRAPRDVIDRAMKYADSVGMRLIWIDQECINQDNRADKEHAIQSMDLVYFNALRSVGLLDGYIDTQEQMDALSWIMEYPRFYGTPAPEAFEEVLDLISKERWLTRAWIFQEAVAANKRMMLLLRCNPNLKKPSHLGTVPGEITVSLAALQYLISLMQSQEGKPLRRQLDGIYAMRLYGSSGLHAFQHLAELQNSKSRVSDKLAILGNLCDYPIRLDTTELNNSPEVSSSLSSCAFAMAMMNGDISFVMGFLSSSAFAPITMEKDTSERDDNDNSFSWTPPFTTSFKNIGFAASDPPCRISCQLYPEGLRVKGWFWDIDEVVHLPKTKARYSLTKLSVPINEIPLSERGQCIEATFQYAEPRGFGFPDVEIFWDILRELMDMGHVDLAQIIWDAPCVRENKLRSDKKRFDKECNLPKDVREVVDLNTGKYLLDEPPYNVPEYDAPDLFLSNHEYLFISYRVARDGRFWHSNKNAIADVDGPTKLFIPELQRPSKRDRVRLAWIVSPTDRTVDCALPVYRGMSVVTGFPVPYDNDGEEILII